MHLCGKLSCSHHKQQQGAGGRGIGRAQRSAVSEVSQSETLNLVKRKQTSASAEMLICWKEIFLQALLQLILLVYAAEVPG